MSRKIIFAKGNPAVQIRLQFTITPRRLRPLAQLALENAKYALVKSIFNQRKEERDVCNNRSES